MTSRSPFSTSPPVLLLFIQLLIILSVVIASGDDKCPCDNLDWCNPITIPLYSRKEVYAFTLHDESWQYFDWEVITTVAHSFDLKSKSSVCLAHSHNARVVFTTVIPENLLLPNTTFEQQWEWVQNQVDRVAALAGDGINIDNENEVHLNETTKRRQLTAVTQLLQVELKKRNPYSSLVWDLGWKPNVDERYYDYKRLSDICDYVFLMVYDTQSQIKTGPPCHAGPNSPVSAVEKSLGWYSSPSSSSDLNIPYEKIILGLPWYGYYYNCTSYDPTTEECTIPTVPFRGVECSDAAGRQIDYPYTIKALKGKEPIFDHATLSMKAFVTTTPVSTTATTAEPPRVNRNPSTSSTMTAESRTVAYYFDSPASIKAKVIFAWNITKGRVGGVGMWNADVPNYTNPNEGQSFWNSMILPPTVFSSHQDADSEKGML